MPLKNMTVYLMSRLEMVKTSSKSSGLVIKVFIEGMGIVLIFHFISTTFSVDLFTFMFFMHVMFSGYLTLVVFPFFHRSLLNGLLSQGKNLSNVPFYWQPRDIYLKLSLKRIGALKNCGLVQFFYKLVIRRKEVLGPLIEQF